MIGAAAELNNSIIIPPEIDELYQVVWSKPMTKIGKQFDVSASYLARLFTLLDVPRPERGTRGWQGASANTAPSAAAP